MSRARDDRKRNMRGAFATYYDDGAPVGSFTIGHADGCEESFTEDGAGISAAFGDMHEPGSHAELHAVCVEPRRRSAALLATTGPAFKGRL